METCKEAAHKWAAEFLDDPPRAGELADWIESRLLLWKNAEVEKLTNIIKNGYDAK